MLRRYTFAFYKKKIHLKERFKDYIDELLDKIIVKEKVDNTQNKSCIEFNIILV